MSKQHFGILWPIDLLLPIFITPMTITCENISDCARGLSFIYSTEGDGNGSVRTDLFLVSTVKIKHLTWNFIYLLGTNYT